MNNNSKSRNRQEAIICLIEMEQGLMEKAQKQAGAKANAKTDNKK